MWRALDAPQICAPACLPLTDSTDTAPLPSATSKRHQPISTKKANEHAPAHLSAAAQRPVEGAAEPRVRPLTSLKEAAARPTAVRARSASSRTRQCVGGHGGVDDCASAIHAAARPNCRVKAEMDVRRAGAGVCKTGGGEAGGAEVSDEDAANGDGRTSCSQVHSGRDKQDDSMCHAKLQEILSGLQRDESVALSTADLLAAIMAV